MPLISFFCGESYLEAMFEAKLHNYVSYKAWFVKYSLGDNISFYTSFLKSYL